MDLSKLSDEEVRALASQIAARRSGKADFGKGLARSAGQGLTFGFGDEIEAGIRAIGDGTYREEVEKIRSEMDQFRSENPYWSTGAEIAGGLLTGGVGGAKALASTGLRNMPRLAALGTLGAVEGGVAGAGYAKDMGEIPRNVLTGAALGGALGAAGRGIERTIQRTPVTQAGRHLQKALKRDGMTKPQVEKRLKELGPEGMLADVSPNLQATARVVANQPGAGKSIAEKALNTRQKGMAGRVDSTLKRITGAEDEFLDYLDEIAELRRTKAKPLYDSAYKATIRKQTPAMERALRSDEGQAAWNEALKRVSNQRGIEVDNIAKINPESMPEVWDQWNRIMRGKSNAAFRQGNNDIGSYLSQLRKEAILDIDKAVPVFKKARKVASGPISMREAADEGRKLFSGKVDITTRQVANMADDEKDAFIAGAVRAIQDKLDQGVETANLARNLIKTRGVRERLRAAFKTEAQYKKFIKSLERESEMGETFSNILRGSRTMPMMMEQADVTRPVGIMADAAMGNYQQAAQGATNAALSKIVPKQLPDEVSRELGNALFSRGPQALQYLNQVNQMAVPGRSFAPMVTYPMIQQGTGLLGHR